MEYVSAGWAGVLPIYPPREKGQKGVPHKGLTGRSGEDLGYDCVDFIESRTGQQDIGLRMPADVIGIDVDEYGDKHGWATFCGLIVSCGPVPGTWSNTRRGPGKARQFFFRVPAGTEFVSCVRPDVDVLQRHHRFALVWPSVKDGETYRWYRPDGSLADEGEIPRKSELPELPARWLERLGRRPAARLVVADRPAGVELLAGVQEAAGVGLESACRRVRSHWPRGEMLAGGRHDGALRTAVLLVFDQAEGHRGAGAALTELERLFGQATGGGREEEFARLLSGAGAKVAAQLGVDRRQAVAPNPGCCAVLRRLVGAR